MAKECEPIASMPFDWNSTILKGLRDDVFRLQKSMVNIDALINKISELTKANENLVFDLYHRGRKVDELACELYKRDGEIRFLLAEIKKYKTKRKKNVSKHPTT